MKNFAELSIDLGDLSLEDAAKLAAAAAVKAWSVDWTPQDESYEVTISAPGDIRILISKLRSILGEDYMDKSLEEVQADWDRDNNE